MVRNRRQNQHAGMSKYGHSVSEMIAMLDVQSMLIDAPATSVRQTIDVERLEDEIVSGSDAVRGSSAITVGVGSTDRIAAAISDYDMVSEHVRTSCSLFVELVLEPLCIRHCLASRRS